MRERFSKIVDSIKAFTQKLSKKTKNIIVALLLLVVFMAIGLTIFNVITPYEVLFTGLNEQELSEVTTKVQEMGVSMKTASDGTILVPRDEEPKVKVALVSEGYPKSGFTYDYFKNNINMMTTDSEKTFYKIADLQERLASTIRLFDGVKDAKVTIGIADDKKYILQTEKSENTASVTVITQSGETPERDQVMGIQRLVAKSIPNLKLENVGVIDGNGRDVTIQGDGQMTSSTLKLQLEKELEATAKEKILHLLTPIYGEDKLRVAVKTNVDIDKKIKEIINYVPSEENEGKGVVSKEQTSINGTPNTAGGGVPGEETNADIPTYPGVTTDGKTLIFSDDKSFDYVVSQIKEQIQSDAGTLLDTTIAITADGVDITADRLAAMKRLIANATGIPVEDAQTKVEIISSPFIKGENADGDPITDEPGGIAGILNLSWQAIAILAGIILFIVIVAVIIILSAVRKSKKAKKALLEQQAQLDALMAARTEAESVESVEELRRRNMEKLEDFKLGQIKETREKKLQSEIASFSSANPEISAQLIKNWLRGGDLDES